MTDQNPSQNDRVRGTVRFLSEIIAWVVTPWALWPISPVLAVGAVVLLIGLPAIWGTPGDRPGGRPLVPAHGIVTILGLLLQLGAATAGSWVVWPWWAAATVTALCLTVVVTEQPRWRWLMRAPYKPVSV